MKKKYYYDCWIQALYMMREFDVKFFTKGHLNIESDFLEMELGYHLNIRDIYSKLANDHTKIYVKPESEHIFEPKDYDSGIYNGALWTFIARQWVLSSDCDRRTERDDFIKNIVKRDNKHFFAPITEEN